MTAFELWDTKSHNLVGDYDTQAAALEAVIKAARKHGVEAVRSLILVRVGPRGGLKRVAVGSDLAELALSTAPSARAVG